MYHPQKERNYSNSVLHTIYILKLFLNWKHTYVKRYNISLVDNLYKPAHKIQVHLQCSYAQG